MPDHSGELLIASPSRWDEACFAVPAVRALLASGWDIAVLCDAGQQDFWRTLPGLATIPVHTRESARALGKRLHNQWRSAIVWEKGTLSDAIRKASPARILGPAGEPGMSWVSMPIDLAPPPKTHRVEFYLAAARALGREAKHPQLFEPALRNEEEHPLLLIPDSDFGPSHEWPLDRWRDLAGRLQESGRSFHVADVQTGRKLGARLAQGTHAETTTLQADARALAVLSRYRFVIAADGSLPHLASQAGATCLTLFGPNDPVTRRPLGRRHVVARHHVECAPCRLPTCPLDHRCQLELSVERVWKAGMDLLS